MDGISRSRGWDKEIPHDVLPMEQLVLSDKWARTSRSMICGERRSNSKLIPRALPRLQLE